MTEIDRKRERWKVGSSSDALKKKVHQWQLVNKLIWTKVFKSCALEYSMKTCLHRTCSEMNSLDKSRASEDLSINHRLPVHFGGKGIWLSNCKYLSLVTQYNNASCRTRKNLEENLIRDFIVLEILALWEKLCLLYPQHILTTLLLFE